MECTFLLSDEKEISVEDYQERVILFNEFTSFPDTFVTDMRHLQPQIGCMNMCEICSQDALGVIEQWTEKRMRNVIAAIKHRAQILGNDFPLIAGGRKKHRPGVIFPYLNNDIGNYFYLDKFIYLLYKELGVQTRISTIGYSRYNEQLNKMHKRINTSEIMEGVGGVRLSFTPYGRGWGENQGCSRDEYILDMANFLKIYKEYHKKEGAGYRKMCVEIRYSPLAVNAEVWVTDVCHHMIICTNNYLFISKDKNINMEIAEIVDPDNHFIELSKAPSYFHEIDIRTKITDILELQRIAEKHINDSLDKLPMYEVYLMENSEGMYFAVDPCISVNGNFGINIYPCTNQRETSGYVVTERFLLNAMFEYKNKKNIASFSKFDEATWEDVDNVLKLCSEIAQKYKRKEKYEKSQYIETIILPMIKGYVYALKLADYHASDFFDPDFTIDTGIICNLGRAISEFKGLCKKRNEPLTPTHERNYGRKNSLMVKEGKVWRVSCGYRSEIIVEELDLRNTSSVNGQVVFRKKIQLGNENEVLNIDNMKEKKMIPGQRRDSR